MKKGRFSTTLGLLLIAAALCLTGYNIYDSNRAGKESDDFLTELAPMIGEPIPGSGRYAYDDPQYALLHPDEIEYPDYMLNPEMEMPTTEIKGKPCIGILTIPSLEKSFPIISEWSYPNLKTAPCRYSGSAYLDNMVICGHNYKKHFGPVRDLPLGAEILFTDVDGNIFRYTVSEVENIRPAAIDDMLSGDWDLTLFTCTASTRARVAVRCERVHY